MPAVERVQFRGAGPEALNYEGVLTLPDGGGPWPGVVLCHAHPYYGGSMDLPLMVALGDVLAARGLLTLRFNFRGVGASAGAIAGGAGEVDDVLAALDFLWLHPVMAGHCPGLGLVGYSFGGWAALMAAERWAQELCGFVGVAFGATLAAPDWTPAYRGPKCFIHGMRDQVVSPALFEEFYARVPAPKEKHLLPADHFFIGREGEVASISADFLRAQL